MKTPQWEPYALLVAPFLSYKVYTDILPKNDEAAFVAFGLTVTIAVVLIFASWISRSGS